MSAEIALFIKRKPGKRCRGLFEFFVTDHCDDSDEDGTRQRSGRLRRETFRRTRVQSELQLSIICQVSSWRASSARIWLTLSSLCIMQEKRRRKVLLTQCKNARKMEKVSYALVVTPSASILHLTCDYYYFFSWRLLLPSFTFLRLSSQMPCILFP